MVNVVTPIFPALSVTLQFTIVWPTENKDPDGGLHVTGPSSGDWSDAVGVKYWTAVPDGFMASFVIFSVSEKVGGKVSSFNAISVILKLEDVVFPTVSDAVHVTVVVPIRK